MKKNVSRRHFLGSLGAGAALVPFVGFPAVVKRRNANEMLSHACIGCANMARADMMEIRSHRDVHIAAICDVDSRYLEEAKKLNPDAKVYRDAFEMFADMGERIDSVNVSTPDHTHAQYVIEALKRGLNVYSEKPLCTKLGDSREILRLTAEKGAVTQLGTQIAAWDCDRRTAAAISSGLIGEVRHVWLFSTRRPEPGPEKFRWPLKPDPVPATLDWKLWLGPAAERPFVADAYHPGAWRKWRDFGSSWLGDLGIHLISPVWLGLGLGAVGADSVKAEVAELDWTDEQRRQFWPTMSHVTWRFPGIKASGMQPFEVEWFDGFGNAEFRLEPKFFPPAFLQDVAALTPMRELPPQGRVIEGTKGWILSTHFGPDPFVVSKTTGFCGAKGKADDSVTSSLPGGGPKTSHHWEFVDACLQGGSTTSPFAKSAKMSEWCMTGNFAQLQPDKWLKVEDLLAKELKG